VSNKYITYYNKGSLQDIMKMVAV